MKKNRKIKFAARITSLLLALCMVVSIAPIAAFAEGLEGSETTTAGKQHVLCKGNDWDISDELIMPGESFCIEPEYIVDYYPLTAGAPEVGASIMLSNAEFVLGEVTVDDSGLTKSTADTGLEPITTNYNVIEMAYANGDLNKVFSGASDEDNNALNSAIKNGSISLTTGYVNNTNTPIRISNIKMSSTMDAGDVYGGEFGLTLLVMANYTRRSGCTITYYEPSYTLSYEGLLSGEEEGLPDHFDVQCEKQELELTNPVRPGYHFVYWNGMYFADTAIKSGDKTIFSIEFPCNINADSDLTLTPLFEQGFTVTFNPNGGTIEGKNSAIYEIGLSGDEFIDIGDYVPEREGYTFEGWCSYPSADDDSLI
ncbi:MAG: InlB B-repeat-containing protein, partial [Acutalibacteraceae bacterium]